MTGVGGEQRRRPVALTIAGSDSSGGAGVVADLKTFQSFGVWGTVAITAVTAQNSLGIQVHETMPALMVRAQIASVASDLGVDAAKTGMLATAATVEAVASTLTQLGVSPLVVDPVLMSSQGDELLDPDGLAALRRLLLPLATIVTPNLAEARALTGCEVGDRDGMVASARLLVGLGAHAALVTGGHLNGTGSDSPTWETDGSPDCLVIEDSDEAIWLEGARLGGVNTHGTGCVLSAAICAGLANGLSIVDACRAAKAFVSRAIGSGVTLGAGSGSLDPGVVEPPGVS